MLTPRWYQSEGIQAVWDYFLANPTGNPVLAHPTGTGKSITIGGIVKKAVQEDPTTRIIMATHRHELIKQNFDELLGMWPLAPAGCYSAGLGRKEHRNAITYAGIDSIARQPELFGHIDLGIVDECHMVSPKESTKYRSFFAGLLERNPALRIIGLTATPYRLGQGLVTDDGLFTDIIHDLTTFENFNRLVDEGWLAPLVPRRTETEIDLTDVRVQAGEYNLVQLQEASDKEIMTCRAVDEMVRLGSERKHWLVFASGVQHSDHVAAELNHRGIRAVSIHSKMDQGRVPPELLACRQRDESLRDTAIRLWKSGYYRAAVNNDILTTGINFPAIDLIGMLRATLSVVLWIQMLGRGTRPFPGKVNCLVLDFAGNTRRLGPINDPIIPRKRGKGGGTAPIKECEVCGTYNHTTARVCCACGAPFSFAVKFVDKADTLALLATADPVVETFPVTNIEYALHRPHPASGKRTPSLRVTYFSGLRCFYEWVCLEHPSNIRLKAERWWRQRSSSELDAPATIADALIRSKELAIPSYINVWIKRKNSEILSCDFISKPVSEI